MKAEILWSIGTLALWAGLALGLRALWMLAKLVMRPVGLNPEKTKRDLFLSAAATVILLLFSLSLPMDVGRAVNTRGMHVPLVWWLAPFPAWFAMFSVFMVVVRMIQSFTDLTPQESRKKVVAAVIWFLLAGGSVYWFQEMHGKVKTFRGLMPINLATVGVLFGLVVITILAMLYAERATRTRGYAKSFVTHVTLLVGCLIFGMPFLWLLITSFKEDRDMSSASGIVWVPRVQEQVPFDDPKRPLVQTTFEGKVVEALVHTDKVEANGELSLEIDRPLFMRGREFTAKESEVKHVPRMVNVISAPYQGRTIKAFIVEDFPDGRQTVRIMEPKDLAGQDVELEPGVSKPFRNVGLRWQNYSDALEWLPPETNFGLKYLQNTLFLVIMSVIGTILSSSLVAYGFSRLRFPGKGRLFAVMLSTMMLPGAVTMLPTFLIFRGLGWIDTLYPLWVPTFFAGAFNVFLLRQFFLTIPMELEDSAKIDGCSYLRTYWQVMMPQIRPALAVIAIWTFMGAWNNFMGPLIYLNTPEKMPIAYAVQLFQGDRGGEFGLMMAFATMATIPVLALFFFCQKYFIEGVQLSGMGGR